ncbi:src substrate cortactin-like [Cavia porcellus]|uniref:src substrate cortactin-like n=1 Tax=Cavia porcellus TaxID=10141 RepID=UPI002FDF21BD
MRMWKASTAYAVSITQDDRGADNWGTDPDFVNDVSKKEQRWGSKTLQGSRHQEHINIYKIRENVFQEHHTLKEKELQTGPKASHGYGGKFCVEQYSMDKVFYLSNKKNNKSGHLPSLTDVLNTAQVARPSIYQSAVGHEYQLKLAKHCSQVDSVRGFGGKFGVQMDRVDQSASTFEGVAQVSSAY